MLKGVYDSQTLATYVNKYDVVQLLNGLTLDGPLFARKSLIAEAGIRLQLPAEARRALVVIVQAERSVYGEPPLVEHGGLWLTPGQAEEIKRRGKW